MKSEKQIIPLDEKIVKRKWGENVGDGRDLCVCVEDIKENLQNLQEELKEKIKAHKNSDWCKVGTKDQQEGRKAGFDIALEELNKLFLKHIGERLIKRK